MKSLSKFSILIAALIQFVSCSDNDPSQRDIKIALLTATAWGNPIVMHYSDGDLSEEYADFVISFTKSSSDGFDGSFVVSNGGYAFTETFGQWKFNDNLTAIQLSSGKEIQYQFAEDKLILDFMVSPPSGGRINGLSGHFVFELSEL